MAGKSHREARIASPSDEFSHELKNESTDTSGILVEPVVGDHTPGSNDTAPEEQR